jgi:ribosomal protein S12 methylthiotransferase accessory factor
MSVQTGLEDLIDDLRLSAAAINAYHDRCLSPGQTFAAIKPHFAELGITRVGLLTGLDLLEIPVAFATRPNSHTLSVFQGKGIDEDAAMTSAAMEAVETRVAEMQPVDLIVATLDAMRAERAPIIDLESVARCVPSNIETGPIAWGEGIDIVSNKPMFVPWSLVGLDHRGERPSGFEQSSDGLASGNRPAEAVLHGLCELVERDAWALMQLRPYDQLRGCRIDPAALCDPVVDIVVDRITRAGMRLLLLDMTTDIAIPSFLAVIVPDNLADRADARFTHVCGGCGCHPDPVRAALRAITEAAQSRLTAIAGSRDDFSPRLYQRLDGAGPMQQLIDLCDEKPAAPRFAIEPAKRSIQENIRHIVGRLQSRGIEQVVVVPLSHPRLPVSIVRVIVPGLEVDVTGEFIQLGLRAVGAMQGALS